jgi:hypothetical protein
VEAAGRARGKNRCSYSIVGLGRKAELAIGEASPRLALTFWEPSVGVRIEDASLLCGAANPHLSARLHKRIPMAEISEDISTLLVRGAVALLIAAVVWSAFVVALSLTAIAAYSMSGETPFLWIHNQSALLAVAAILLGYGWRRLVLLTGARD